MESDTKRLKQSSQIENSKIIGSGTFNCAKLIENNDGTVEVLRIALMPLDRPDQRSMVLRGLHIVQMMQSYMHIIGPSLVEQTKTYDSKVDLTTYEIGTLCMEMQERIASYKQKGKQFHFALQHLEYLAGGPFYTQNVLNNKEEFDFCCFSLLWFFRTTLQLFDLRHRDLKPFNIILRQYESPVLYRFIYKNGQDVMFKSEYVPVVIDFDFASVSTTKEDVDREIVGTYNTAHPAALFAELFNLLFMRIPNFSIATLLQEERMYDWWSLGVNLFYVAMQPYFEKDMFFVFQDETTVFVARATKIFVNLYAQDKKAVFDRCQEPNNKRVFAQIAYGLCVKSIVKNFPAKKNKQSFFPRNFPKQFVDLLTVILDYSENVKLALDIYKQKIPLHIQNVLSRLFSKRLKVNPETFIRGGQYKEDPHFTFFESDNDDAQLKKDLAHQFLQLKI